MRLTNKQTEIIKAMANDSSLLIYPSSYSRHQCLMAPGYNDTWDGEKFTGFKIVFRRETLNVLIAKKLIKPFDGDKYCLS